MTWQSGGNASLPGIAGNGQVPGGLTIAGRIAINKPNPVDALVYPLSVGDGAGHTIMNVDTDGSVSLNNDITRLLGSGGMTTSGVNLQNGTLALQNDAAAPAISILQSGSQGQCILCQDDTTFDILQLLSRTGSTSMGEGVGVFGHAAPDTQPVLATGSGKTPDDIIALLQSYGICKQA